MIDPSDAYKEDRFFRDEAERNYQLAKAMDIPKNSLPLEHAPRNGKWLLLIGDSGYRGVKYRAIVAKYVKEYEKPGEDQAEQDRRCWRDTRNDHVTDSGAMPEFFMYVPWEYECYNLDTVIEIIFAAILEDNSNRTHAKDLTAGDETKKAIALIFGITRAVVGGRQQKPKCCPSCAAIAKISTPLATITECPACGVKSPTEDWYSLVLKDTEPEDGKALMLYDILSEMACEFANRGGDSHTILKTAMALAKMIP